MTKPHLALVQPEPSDPEEQRRITRAKLLAGHIPEREDVREYPGGHVWVRRREHETMVLRVIGRRFG